MTTTTLFVGLVVALVVVKMLRAASAEDPEVRARLLAQTVLAEYKSLESASLPIEERRIRALLSTGTPEAEVRGIAARAASPLHGTLQMMTISLAARQERERNTDSAALMRSIVRIQQVVMATIPGEL